MQANHLSIAKPKILNVIETKALCFICLKKIHKFAICKCLSATAYSALKICQILR